MYNLLSLTLLTALITLIIPFSIDNLPKKAADLTSMKLRESVNELPSEIQGISNIYRPLELILMGTAFELSALVILDALVNELMWNLNLREKDLKAYHDVLSSSI